VPPLGVEHAHQAPELLEGADLLQGRQVDDSAQEGPSSSLLLAALDDHPHDLPAHGSHGGACGPTVEVQKTAYGAWGLAFGVFWDGHASGLQEEDEQGLQ
jgi:hypothetical protein